MKAKNTAKKKDFSNVINSAVAQAKTFEDIVKENIVILPELKAFIPPLSEEEFAHLSESIINEGCRDALILWQREKEEGLEYVIVDGHNRYAICEENNVEFKFIVREFDNLEQVKDWMILNQLGKRNITELTKSFLRGTRYELEKQKNKNVSNLKQFQTEGDKMSSSGKTSEKLAEEFNVSEKTIKRDAEYARAVNAIAQGDDVLKWKILNKEVDLPKNYLVEVVEKGELAIQELRAMLVAGKGLNQVEENKIETKTGKTTTKVDTGKFVIDDLKPFQSNIYQAVREVMSKQDEDSIEKLKTRVDELAKEVKKRKN
ncbi:MAG: ParB N-terminal domain-containing protein [Microscillaceae bacterium]|jgi:ParB-like chromosome segregation protein Spo0J|nr:ParB N-terminal domain-containing protein [Microscillaceae bacterium]